MIFNAIGETLFILQPTPPNLIFIFNILYIYMVFVFSYSSLGCFNFTLLCFKFFILALNV